MWNQILLSRKLRPEGDDTKSCEEGKANKKKIEKKSKKRKIKVALKKKENKEKGLRWTF